MTKISIITPCYYNQDNIPVTAEAFIENEKKFPNDVCFEYVMVDDASGDDTLKALLDFKKNYPEKVKVIKLAGNVGSYNAVLAGIEYATGDCLTVVAADLQDPPELILEMYRHWKNGYKLVIGNRMDREDAFAQKIFSNSFHFLMRRFALKNAPNGGFDYVFFDRQIAQKLLQLQERNSNIFYLMLWMGYAYVNIPYTRKKREIGKSKWTFSKKMKLLIDSFVSFSFAPLRAITIGGLVFGVAAFIYAIAIIVLRIWGGIEVEGWSALMVVLLVVSSFQMIALGILGEYVWRTLDAVKKRPLYIVEKIY